MKKENGITLVALIVTVVILVVLTGVGLAASTKYVDNAKMKSFFTKLEIAEEGIRAFSSDFNDPEELSGLGADLTGEQMEFVETLGYTSIYFRYFTANEVKSILNIEGVDLNLLIDFTHNIVINPEGIEIDGQTYYELENRKYTVNFDVTKTLGPVDFSFAVTKYGNNRYKIIITPANIGDIKDGTIKYKKTLVDYWLVANDNVIIVRDLSSYDIKYTDSYGNTITKTLVLSLDGQNNPVLTEQ